MAASLVWNPGLDTLQSVLTNISPRVTQFLTESMEEVSIAVFNESQIEVPVLTGALKASGHVDPPEVAPGQIVINIGYGGVASHYALVVHEDLSMNHPRGGKAKFLEDPMHEALGALTARLSGRMEAAMIGTSFGAPASAVAQQTMSATRGAKVNVRSGSRSRAMSSAQVSAALQTIQQHPTTGATYRAGRLGRLRMKF